MSDQPSGPARSTASGRPSRKSRRASFGSVRKLPSGRYQARYTDKYDVRHTAPHTFATKKQAEDWLATTRADMVRGTWQAPELGSITLGNFTADHLATRLDLAPKTRQIYDAILVRWINQPLTLPAAPGRRPRFITLGDYELSAISVAVVREWYAAALHTAHSHAEQRAADAQAYWIKTTAVHAARAWARSAGIDVPSTGRLSARVVEAWKAAGSPPTSVPAHLAAPAPVAADAGRAAVAQAYRFLRTMLGHAAREGRIPSNPVDLAGAGALRSRERVPATPAEVDALAAHMPARYAAAVHVAAWSGLRAGELFGLARKHVDLDAGTVRVERAAVTSLRGVAPHLGATKTDSSRRTVHLPPHVVERLGEHMAEHTGADPEALVFTDDAGRIVSRETRQRHFLKARRAVGRTDLRWHDLRHTGATLAAQAGASVRELQHRLGHSTFKAAMVYQHASFERDRDLAQRLSVLAHQPAFTDAANRRQPAP